MLKNDQQSVFVTCPKGLNYILEKELLELGATQTKSIPAGVHARVDKKALYTILLWSRIANRVILPLGECKLDAVDQMYDLAYGIDWPSHFSCQTTFAVNFSGTNELVNNTEFGALKIKDAIVDKFRDKLGDRPSVDRKTPGIRISAVLAKGKISIGIDLSGESLHKRGYRLGTGKAPLKENLAAGVLRLAGWPDKFSEQASFIDPMCGSATFLIEAAMIAYDKAPGLERTIWGFSAWKHHDDRLWEALVEAAKDRYSHGKSHTKRKIIGFDENPKVIAKAWENITAAGFDSDIHIERKKLIEFSKFEKLEQGLLLTNPPYGERLGTVRELISVYQNLGEIFESHLLGWKAGILTGNIDLGKSIGWRSFKQYKLFNGALESQLILVDLKKENRYRDKADFLQSLKTPDTWRITNNERADMFRNRLKKNMKALKKWLSRESIECFRLYDADMPEFSVAVDVYHDLEGASYLHVQEYQAPKSVSLKSARERLAESLKVLSEFGEEVLNVPAENISVKQRSVQKGTEQYQKEGETKRYFITREHGINVRVNLHDYLDTGLFLDHRPVRRLIASMAKGKRFLNLFSYTGVCTLHAIQGGAASTLSIDMSKTYLRWLEWNLSINKFSSEVHKVLQADCIKWLEENKNQQAFDLIFLDPPTFSNSKRMEGVLDIQRDHETLIDNAMSMLSDDGALIFSNNLRRFKLDDALQEKYQVSSLTEKSFDPDFARNRSIHQVWQLRKK